MTTDNIVLITGSGGGLGQSLIDQFLEAGFIVFAGVRELGIDVQKTKIHPKLHSIKLDITSTDDILACKEAIEKVGNLKVLINNAGISGWGSFWKRDMQMDRQIFDINLWGSLNMIRNFWDLLEQNRGTIVNIGSISGVVPTPFISAYSASKSALEKMMLAIFLEKKTHIRILHLNLGPLTRGMCGGAIEKEGESYKEKIRLHMVKIQKIHGYDVEKVGKYIRTFLSRNTQYEIKTLGLWAKFITFFSHLVPQPYYQKLIGKLYKSI